MSKEQSYEMPRLQNLVIIMRDYYRGTQKVFPHGDKFLFNACSWYLTLIFVGGFTDEIGVYHKSGYEFDITVCIFNGFIADFGLFT